MNTPVNFEIAKLLKEKGFDEPCSHAYKEVESPILYVHQDKKYNNSFKKEWQNTVRKNSHMDNAVINRYSAPTIAEVVMWLYEKHGVWVRVTPIPYSDNLTHWRWEHMSTNYSTRNFKWKKEQDYMSPTEAYEADIEYTLKNLI